MADGDRAEEVLRREIRVFGRHLLDCEPGSYAVSRYLAWHAASGSAEADGAPRFDRFLVAVARLHPLGTRLADVYCARFRRGALLRRKLVLVLALIECSPGTWRLVESPRSRGRFGAFARIAVAGAVEALTLLVAALLFLPACGLLAALPARRVGAA